MKILLIGNYQKDEQRSMLRYCQMLQTALAEKGLQVNTWQPKSVLGAFIPKSSNWFKWIAYFDKFVFGSLYLMFKQVGYDRIHICDHSNAIYNFILYRRKLTLTCHDVIAIKAADGEGLWKVKASGKLFQKLILSGIKRSSGIICVSHHTKKQLLELIDFPVNQLVVAYNPIDINLLKTEAKRLDIGRFWGGTTTAYIMHVGSDEIRKNRLGAIKIWAQLLRYGQFRNVKFLLVGPSLSKEQREYVEEAELQESVVAVSLDDNQLSWAYQNAEFLLFPSYLEGYGWPITEAQALGCPVVTSDVPPMTEIGGDGALYIDPDNYEGAARKIVETDFQALQGEARVAVKKSSVSLLVDKFLEIR